MESRPDSERASAAHDALDSSGDRVKTEGTIWDRRAKLVLALSLVLLLVGAWRVGPTFDEHFYIASGYSYWKTGDFALNREHPPLVKLMVGLPLLFTPDVSWTDQANTMLSFPRTWFFQMNGEHWVRNLFLARLPMCLATAALAWMVYRTARRLFSARAAFFALLVFALNPNMLAHGRLAALDGGLTVFLFLAVLSFAELMASFGWRRLVLAGFWFGLANLAKFTSLVTLPLFLGLAVVEAVRRKSLWPIGALAGTCLIGSSVFAAGYGFEAKSIAEVTAVQAYFERDPASSADGAERKLAFERLLERDALDSETEESLSSLAGVRLTSEAAWRAWFEANRDADWNRSLFASSELAGLTRGTLGDERPIPVLSALKGVDYQLQHGSKGHGTVFRGQPLSPGADFETGNPFPEYYAVVWLVKNPVGFSALAALGLLAVLRLRERLGLVRLLALLGFPLALFALFSTGNALMGVKYLLPIFPFAALWVAGATEKFPRAGALLATLAVLEGAILLPQLSPAHPNELMYYNAVAGGPVGGPWTTVVGDDWGQDAKTVGEFYTRYRAPIERAGGLHYDPYTRADLGSLGLAGIERAFDEPTGIVAVHALDYYRDRARYEWLRDYEPFLRIGWSVYVYDTRTPAPGGDPLAGWTAGGDS